MNIKAIVLNIRDYRENDRIITCYVRELGKIEILVRSARKIASKLAHLTSGLYALLNLTIEPGRNFYHLIGGEIKKYFNSINNNCQKNIQSGRVLNIVDMITKSAKPDRKVFDLIVKTLEKINAAPEVKAEIFIYAFLIKFLSFLGYKPEIKKCLICYKATNYELNTNIRITNGVYFDFSKGGIVCQNCQVSKQNILPMNQSSLKFLQDLLYKDFNVLEEINFKSADFTIVKNVIDKFLEWHLK